MRGVLLAVSTAAVLAACAWQEPEPSAVPPAASGSPAPQRDEVGLSCGDDLGFHPAVLDEPGTAELAPDPAAAALREEIAASPPDGEMPRSGWIRVVNLPHLVRFIAPGGYESGWAQFAVELRDGAWRLAVSGQCRLQPVAAAGTSVGRWWLDPAFPRPDATARTVRALVQELDCASGRPPDGRVLPPVVAFTDESVTITMLIRRPLGDQNCQGAPPLALEITLPQPLGDRLLLDGGVYPPRDASLPAGL